jgi:hypothetical protein
MQARRGRRTSTRRPRSSRNNPVLRPSTCSPRHCSFPMSAGPRHEREAAYGGKKSCRWPASPFTWISSWACSHPAGLICPSGRGTYFNAPTGEDHAYEVTLDEEEEKGRTSSASCALCGRRRAERRDRDQPREDHVRVSGGELEDPTSISCGVLMNNVKRGSSGSHSPAPAASPCGDAETWCANVDHLTSLLPFLFLGRRALVLG